MRMGNLTSNRIYVSGVEPGAVDDGDAVKGNGDQSRDAGTVEKGGKPTGDEARQAVGGRDRERRLGMSSFPGKM